MLYYCFIPKSFCISTMIPIPKGSNKDTTDIRNYICIALSSLLSTLFDSCIISLNTVVFKSDDLQFAYKNICSTIQCVSVVTEVIDNYKKTMTALFICVCSMHPRLLYSRGMCPIYIGLLMKIYEEQQMHIRWNNAVPDYFTINRVVCCLLYCSVYTWTSS